MGMVARVTYESKYYIFCKINNNGNVFKFNRYYENEFILDKAYRQLVAMYNNNLTKIQPLSKVVL